MRIYIDISASYSLIDRGDENHREGKKAWMQMLEASYTLVTSNYVLVETFALLQSRIGLEAARGFFDTADLLFDICLWLQPFIPDAGPIPSPPTSKTKGLTITSLLN
jgi:predicted nucleic acid-binding protein